MQISKQQLDPTFEREIKEMLAQVIADIPSKEKALAFLNDFLSETEYVVLAKRLAVMYYLSKGFSYEKIKKEVKVSSATIASVQNALDQKSTGFELALAYIKAEVWAETWTSKLSGIFSKKS
jgi:uncharacterized protein YerC